MGFWYKLGIFTQRNFWKNRSSWELICSSAEDEGKMKQRNWMKSSIICATQESETDSFEEKTNSPFHCEFWTEKELTIGKEIPVQQIPESHWYKSGEREKCYLDSNQKRQLQI